MPDVYKNIDEYNPDKEKTLIVFDDMITDTIHNKKLEQKARFNSDRIVY